MEPIVLVHGGAGDIVDSRVPGKIAGVKLAATRGYQKLKDGGSVLDAVEAAVRSMEDDPVFNAGYGSVLNIEGNVEMDASIMNGSNLSAGGVTVVKDIAHPISLARLVMEKTSHILLADVGANKFATEQGIDTVPKDSLVTDDARAALARYKQQDDKQQHASEVGGGLGTVGAVAIDAQGHVAAATSTGGLNGKMVGRCSDSSQIGSGTYADDHGGAVSVTGHGESIAKYCVAHSIVGEMKLLGKTAGDATTSVLKGMTDKLNNTAGAITISKAGQVGIDFTSNRMAWAYQKGNELHYGIEHNQQHQIEKL